MNGFEKYAAYYRGYLADDRRLASVIGVLLTAIALWLLFYLVSLVGPASDQRLRLGAPPAYARTGRRSLIRTNEASGRSPGNPLRPRRLDVAGGDVILEPTLRRETLMPPPLPRTPLFAATPATADATI